MNKIKSFGAFLAGFILLLAFWHLTVQRFKIPSYFLPSPDAVGLSIWVGLVGGSYWPHIEATLTATVIGYLFGCLVGVLIGVIFSEFPLVERIANPYVVALQAIPKVALAPLIIVWFGYGISSKVIMVALICFFPVFVNTVVGIKATNPDQLMLYRAFSASRMSQLFHVKLPSSAGMIFASLQVAVVFALIGTVVTEFVASATGLGTLINSSMQTMDTATMFGSIFILAAIGVLGNELMRMAHRHFVFWEGERRFSV